MEGNSYSTVQELRFAISSLGIPNDGCQILPGLVGIGITPDISQIKPRVCVSLLNRPKRQLNLREI